MGRQLLFIGLMLLQLGLLFAIFVALYDLARSVLRLDGLLAFCATVVLLGVLGYTAFWLAYANYRVFGIAKVIVLALLVARFIVVVYRRRFAAHMHALREPLAFVFPFCVAVLALGLAAGGTDMPTNIAQTRFSSPLPTDNIIPLVIAELLRAGAIQSPMMMGDWLTSDRPPLQAGLYLLLVLKTGVVGYQIVASWLQATFLFGVWGLAIAAALPVAVRRLVMLSCCLLPPVILNTFYTWPKLLAVSYLLLAFALLFRPRPPDEPRVTTGVLIGSLAALAALSHGSSAFALIGFAVAVVIFWAWPPLKAMMAGAAALLALYVPWVLYQQFIDPPGDRLLKWHLAGVVDVDPRPFGQTLREAYAALTWDDYLAGKLEHLRVMIGTWPRSLLDIAHAIIGRDGDIVPAIRIADFFQFLPSLHVFSLALIVALALLPFIPAEQRPQRDFALKMLVALVATLTAFVLLIFIPGQTINHVGSYATQVMVTVFAIMVVTLRAPWLALAFVALQTVTVSAVYAFTLPFDARFWPLTAICIVATVALFGYSLAPQWRRS